MKRRKLRIFPRLGGRRMLRVGGWLARFLVKSQIITIFLGLFVLGIFVGLMTRPPRGLFPYAELFDQLQVVSYRDTPSDTTSRFVVQLCAGGRVFSQYDVESRTFQPPPSGRSYARTITGTHYGALRVRGHVGYGFWLEVPSRRALLPEQYDELYRYTIDLVNPVSKITGLLGILSGYSIGYRLGTWNASLNSGAVQKRVLATPDLGNLIAREAWRRVLLEPVVMTGEGDAARFAAVTGTQQLYANFFRVALDDSNGFIPHEAERLTQLGRTQESRAMLAFAEAAQHAAQDSVHLGNADFVAVERWASLLDRSGHWVQGAIPPPGQERIKLMGTLAWYGLAPPRQNVARVWVGPRMLVRVGDEEGFVADEIPSTSAGCPISWRPHLREENRDTNAMVGAWLADRPEFVALAVFGRRVFHGLGKAQQHLAGWSARARTAPGQAARPTPPPVDAAPAGLAPTIVTDVVESGGNTYSFSLPSLDGRASIQLVAKDSAQAAVLAVAATAVVKRFEPSMVGASPTGVGGGSDTDSAATARSGVAQTVAGQAVDEAADTLRALGVHGAMIELPGASRALGAASSGEPWSPALRDPRGRIPAIARLRLAAGQGFATSTIREPSQGLIGVVVVAADAQSAARWSSTLIALGPAEARAMAHQHAEISAVLIEAGTGTDVIWVERDLMDGFVFDNPARSLFRLESF